MQSSRRGAAAWAFAAGTVAAAVVIAGCSSGQTSSNDDKSGTPAKKTGTITIAYLQKQGDQQYFVDEANGAKQEAAKLGDVKIDVVDLGTDSNKAISAMSTEVGQRVNGIAIVVPDQKIGPQVIDEADNAGIPLVSSDDPIKSGDGNDAAFVGFDSVQMGTSVGQKAGELFKQAGWTASDTKVMAAYKQDLSDCQLREQGEEKGFQSAAGASVPIVKLGTDNSVIDAQNKAGASLTANPNVKHWIVWGCNDESETGVVTALQNNHVSSANILGVGLGGYLTCKDWKAGVQSGNKAALYIGGADVGAAAVRVLVERLRNGTALPPKTIAKTTMVDASNWKATMAECT
ncbi:MAG TPA: substrate-binding domain-containing protein [Jatrophihabitantaceae bacterium]|jgi:L-arabinose transport system substrate-binding protein